MRPRTYARPPLIPPRLAELKASIEAHGLLENLVARAEGPGPDGVGRYAVIAGGRRLAALQALREDGVLGEDHPVPCLMAGNAAMSGELSLAENVVRIAMHPADQAVAFSRSGWLDAPRISGPTATPPDPQATAREEAGVGIGLAYDLRAIRTALIKAHLAEDFDAAFDLLLFQLARAVFSQGYRAAALDIAIRETADRPAMRMNDEAFADWSPGEAMLADRSRLPFEWMEQEDDGKAFAALRALPRSEKQALFAASVARTVKGRLAFEPHACPELEATAARLDIDFAGPARPRCCGPGSARTGS